MNYYESIKRFSLLLESDFDMEGIPTKEMKDFFITRTQKHINFVRKYLKKAISLYPKYKKELQNRIATHDQSKLESPELDPYVLLTWKFKQKDEGKAINFSQIIEKEIYDMITHHLTTNEHHPQYWDQKYKSCPVPYEKRKEASKSIIDANKMDSPSIIEMVCDWAAMSDERGGDPHDWADSHVNKVWMFTDEQTKLIYDTLDKIW